MKFKKVIINGEIFYKPIEEIEEIVEEEFDNIDEKEDSNENLNDEFKESANNFQEDKEEKKDKRYEKVDIQDIVGNIVKEVKSSINQVGVFFDRSFNSKSKTTKLLKILPFLEDDEIHEIVESLLKNDENFKDLNLADIMPFLSQEDCDKVFIKALDNNVENPMNMVHFVSEESLTTLVDCYIEGKYPKLNCDSLYPFLKSEDVKRIFYYELNKK